jgi:uncharacterized protein (TIGR02391 family)
MTNNAMKDLLEETKMNVSAKPPPRKWEIDDLLDLGKRERGKADYLKAIPILILEKWVVEGRVIGEANHIRTRPLARRLEDCKLVKSAFKPKGTSSILGALGAIQSDRNLTRPPLMNTSRDIGGSLVELPFYESLLQKYRIIYRDTFPEDYKKLYPEKEPNWGILQDQNSAIAISPTMEKPEAQDEIKNLFTPIENELLSRKQTIERLTIENQNLKAEIRVLQVMHKDKQKTSNREIIDDELRNDCAKLMQNKETYIDAVRRAGVVLEERLRKISGSDALDKFGVGLVDFAFKEKSGILIISDRPAEQEGVQMLFRGAVQFVRNPPAHKKMQYTELEAWQTISLIDYLLLILQQVRRRHE